MLGLHWMETLILMGVFCKCFFFFFFLIEESLIMYKKYI